MIIFTLLLIVLLFVLAAIVVVIGTGGVVFALIFGDILVCIWLIIVIFKAFKKK